MNKIVIGISLFLVLVVGVFLWTYIFPYRFSMQKPIDIKNISGEYETGVTSAVFHGETVKVPEKELAYKKNVLGVTNSNKRIEVDLTNQRLYAFDGDRKVYDFLVSTGKWGQTPTGTFQIWIKLRYVRMRGGSQALGTYYDLPNVPFVMFFYNDKIPKWRGYGTHGTYWHNNFGHPMSHGCINMKTTEAEQLYYWANPDLQGKSGIQATGENPGTPIIIYGVAPQT